MSLTADAIAALPKVLLHDHLDGGLRPQTIIDLARERGYTELPTTDAHDLAQWFHDAASSGSLERYLETFVHTIAVMQDPEGIARVTAECVEDLAADGVIWAEIRMAPELCTQRGLSIDDAVRAMVAGVHEGRSRAAAAGHDIDAGLLLCAMRQNDRHLDVAQSVVAWRDGGVVGFDIAGPERGFPASRLVAAFDYLRRNLARITVHAGEGDGVASIQDALLVGAERLGHGVRIMDDITIEADGTATLGTLARYVLDRGVPLEICPTSNLQTGISATYAEHPFGVLRQLGFTVTVNTDNRLMSQTTPTQEMARLVDAFGYDAVDLHAYTRAALVGSFAPHQTKERLSGVIDARYADLLGL